MMFDWMVKIIFLDHGLVFYGRRHSGWFVLIVNDARASTTERMQERIWSPSIKREEKAEDRGRSFNFKSLIS